MSKVAAENAAMNTNVLLQSETVVVEAVHEVDSLLRADLLDCWVEASNAGGAIGFAGQVTAEEVAPVLDKALGDDLRTLVVARVDGELAGYGFLVRNDFELFLHWAVIAALQVHPKHQGKGLGSRLLDGLSELGRREGLEFVRLYYRGGLGLGQFYGKSGFVEVGRAPRAIRVDADDYRDSVDMIRTLT